MKTESEASTTDQLIQFSEQESSVMELVSSFKCEINYYQSALERAEKIICTYEETIGQLNFENTELKTNCRMLEDKLSEAMKTNRRNKEKEVKEKDMLSEIDKLNKKLADYENTISILEDKILILNMSIKKQSYLEKYPKVKNPEEILYNMKTISTVSHKPHSVLDMPSHHFFTKSNNKVKRDRLELGCTFDFSHSQRLSNKKSKSRVHTEGSGKSNNLTSCGTPRNYLLY